jgi:hypothetical protein
LETKIDKKKTCGETLQQEKNHVGKHCSNPQRFVFQEKNYKAKLLTSSI